MSPHDDLRRWGEEPASEAELAWAAELSDHLRHGVPPPPSLAGEARASRAIEEMVWTVLSHCCPEPLQAPEGGRKTTPELRLALELLDQGVFVPIAWSHPRVALRDLKRVGPEAGRVTLRTGDRVRLVAECGEEGYLTVFNVGPSGTLNLLSPADLARPARHQAGATLTVADVEVRPPAGVERLYAVWSKRPLSQAQLSGICRPKMALRDLVRIQEAADELGPDDWRAVALEVLHEAAGHG
jgi:hypothetical protein